jgi:hypothetical protein
MIIGMSALFLGACKKNYSCECRNSNAVYPAGDTYSTKKKADDKCKSLSSSDTNCYVK